MQEISVAGEQKNKKTLTQDDESSYKQIMKATSIFGGVQVFNIIISIIRSKFIAVLLGPSGMGIAGLLLSTMGVVGSITNFGLGTSAVRNVSVAAAAEDNNQIATTVSIIRRLVWITGILGTLVTICFSSLLSEITFGDKNYTVAFICISITLLLSQISAGQQVVLQGMRKFKYLAKADMAGVIVGLLVSIPLYYLFGSKGIVPALVISSFLSLFFTWFFSSKVSIPNVKVNQSTFKRESITMLRMGFILTISGIIPGISSYVIKIFIAQTGGVEQVGFYNAGFALINTYVGMVFTAMLTDYYPRLAVVSFDNHLAKKVINEQAEMAILIIAPILTPFLTFINWAVILLYSNKFLSVTGMLHWAALGMFFKTISWAIGTVFLAKGSSSLFFWNELIANIYLLLLNVLGYKLFGLNGLGIAFFVGYAIFFLQVFAVAKMKYAFALDKPLYKIFLIQFLFGVICFVSIEKIPPPFSYIVGSVFIFLSFSYSFFELDKRLAISQLLVRASAKIKVAKISSRMFRNVTPQIETDSFEK